jgi:hypothetical protein
MALDPFSRIGLKVESDDYGYYDIDAPLLSGANAVLVAFCIPALALACALGTYISVQHVAQLLALQGYVPWPQTDSTSDLTSLPLPGIAPSSAIFCNLVPSHSVSYAFTTASFIRALISGITALVGGGVALFGAVSSAKIRFYVLGLGVVIFMGAVAAALPPKPVIFSFNLDQQTVQAQSGTIPLANVASLTEGPTSGILGNYLTISAVEKNGNNFTLVNLHEGADADDLVSEIESFLSTHGKQI